MHFLKHFKLQYKPYRLALKPLSLISVFLALNSSSMAYTVPTHATLTRAAIDKSVLVTDPNLMSSLGLAPFATQKLYSFSGILPTQMSLLPVADLITYGAQYEDQLNPIGAPPHIAFYHFFDPQYSPPTGRGLTILGFTPGAPSPDWILETRGVTFGDQYFSYSKALDRLYIAFSAASPALRNDAFGMVFQSLGHMVHHIQDMGQPQHVRNEAHLDYPKTDAAIFEGEAQKALTDTYVGQLVSRKNYPIPSVRSNPALKKASDYWYSASPSFVGMAEFTAKNFVTYNTGYEFVLQGGAWALKGNPGFPFPNGLNQPSQTLKEIASSTRTVRTVDGQSITKPASCVRGAVYDAFYPAASTQQILACSTLASRFSAGYIYLNWDSPDVWAANHEVLVPRIVSFSAGLINHFFRGQVNIEKKSGNDWQLTNQSWEGASGTYSVFAEDTAGVRAQLNQFPLTLAAGGAATISFNPPDNTEKVVVVFKGQLGEETKHVHGRVISYKKTGAAISLSVDPMSVAAGAAVNLIATVAGNSATGSVQFYIDSVARGSAVALDANGRASVNSGPLTAGFHQFFAEYSGDSSNKKNSTSSSINVVPPAVPCGTPISASGGKDGYSSNMDMGDTPGRVRLQFEAYSIPDGLVVKSLSSGRQFASTGGLVSGLSEFSFDFNPASEGGRYLNFKVTGNSNPDTAWKLTTSCPNQNIAPLGKFKLAVGTDFGPFTSTSPTACGRWDFIIDGKTRISGPSGGLELSSGGGHTVQVVVGEACPFCTTCNQSMGRPYFNAGSGNVYISGQGYIGGAPGKAN